MDEFDYLAGVYCIVPTPFDADGALDEASLANLVDFVIGKGVHGVTILGVMGEAGKVSESERERIAAGAIEAASGRVPVCVGTTHAATDRCIAVSRRAEEMGAQALLIAPPLMARTNESAMRRHYIAVAEAVSLPVLVQDYPPSSGVYMSPEFIARLADEVPSCRFLKLEDEPTAPKTSAVLAANPAVRIFGGLGGLFLLEELRRGAVGTMTGFAFPEILVDIYTRFAGGDVDGATEVFYRHLPLIRFENQAAINLALRKHIYHLRGAIASPRARAPFTPIDETTKAELAEILDRLGLAATAAG